ncbi:ATPase [Granulicella sp. WH15]|uniref:N-acetylglucosamine kinase n=1 Tax=Granulicella sp. WH15 TaxID=2602070 RepID=UPI0013669ED7|nr:BadF/BadG/BcrA/BcrD ATPase family protein [Granulicella sp. WH15]QHN02017.1 ATPase [Granulicella sp. WH15]
MSFFLAVDAGGTKADLVLADEARELARVRTGTIKRMRVDAATAAANLDAGLAEIVAKGGVSLRDVTRTCVGTAGESVPLVAAWLREAFAARVGGELVLVGDVEIALDAAFPGGPGVLVMAGTGSNVAGRGLAGVIETAGGTGPVLSDQGSGYRIGYEGLRAGFLSRDERRETGLLGAVMEFWGLGSVEELMEYANSVPPPDFSRLTEPVVRLAEQGDVVAGEVLQRQGEELGYLVRLVMRRLDGVSTMACAGSVLEKVMPVRDAMVEAVRREFPGVGVLDGVVDPVAGALWRARKGKTL